MEIRNISWWSRRSRLEKKLTLFSCLGLITTIALIASLTFIALYKFLYVDDICLTQDCIEESTRVFRYINPTVDPCHDFYNFACGSFLKRTKLTDEKEEITAFNSHHLLRQHLKEIVEEQIQDDEIEPFKNVKKFYRACFNETVIEARGVTPLTNVLRSMDGGWPVVEGKSWLKRNWTWQKSVVSSRLNGYSVNNFLSIAVAPDISNSTKRIVRMDQAILGLQREYLIKRLNESLVQAYHKYQVDLAVLFGANESLAKVEMKQALNFEIELAEISTSNEDRRDIEKFNNYMTVTELQATYNYTEHDWLSYLNSILPIESQLEPNDTIVVGSLSYFEKLGALMARTNRRVLANYVMWRNAMSSVSFLPRIFRERQQEYNKQKFGTISSRIRWMECVEKALLYYPHALGALYVRKHFNRAAKEQALEMVGNIKEEMKIVLKENVWMDDETKKEAIIKVDMIREQIGYADELLNDTKLAEYYGTFPVTVNESEYYESASRIIAAYFNRNHRNLREPIDKDDWTSYITPAVVNAYYTRAENFIKFPAGILQGIFFNEKRPHYMNYGSIGFIIGHEITHGFDDVGRRFDGKGNLRNWWDNQTVEAYNDKAQCIIDQYGNYTEPMTQLKLNGLRTQGENIADNGGIKISYRAYKRWAELKTEQKMPGFDYTPKQFFWISAAQIWCNVARKASMKNKVLTNVHAPGEFRVIGPLSNMKEFSDDFQCPSGSPMNPTLKCEVW